MLLSDTATVLGRWGESERQCKSLCWKKWLFNTSPRIIDEGRFVVPLPRKPQAKVLGVSQSQAVRWFLALEWSLHAKGNFDTIIQEYFHLGHAEKVPVARACGANVPPTMHVVRKQSSTTAKVRAVFDASAKCSTGVSLNEILLVARFILPWLTYYFIFVFTESLLPLMLIKCIVRSNSPNPTRIFIISFRDIILRNIPKITVWLMWRCLCFLVCCQHIHQTKLNQLCFRVPFCCGCGKQIILCWWLLLWLWHSWPSKLHHQLMKLFEPGKFLLHKWNLSDVTVLQRIPPELRDSHLMCVIQATNEYTKTLGIEWNPLWITFT